MKSGETTGPAPKVADLGLGRHFSQETQAVNSKVGTPYYVSPEVVKGSPYDWSSDVWSLGCLLYELATLRSPFEMEDANLYAVFRRISKAAYAPLPSGRFSQPLLSLVRRMLFVDPESRPDIDEVLRVCAAAVGEFDKVDLGPTRGLFAAAETLADRLTVLRVESARFKEKYRPGPLVFKGVHPVAFIAPVPPLTAGAQSAAAAGGGGGGGGESDRDRFGRAVRIGSWLLLLLGRKSLTLEAEAEALTLHFAEVEVERAAGGKWRGGGGGGGGVAGDGGGRRSAADTFIDPAGLDGGGDKSHVRDEIGGSGSGGGGGVGDVKGKGGEGKGKGALLPLPSALASEALAQASEEESKRHEIAAHFLEEAAKYGVATEFMCPHAVAKGYGWAVVSALGQLCEAAFVHLKVRTRAPQRDDDASLAEEEESRDAGVDAMSYDDFDDGGGGDDVYGEASGGSRAVGKRGTRYGIRVGVGGGSGGSGEEEEEEEVALYRGSGAGIRAAVADKVGIEDGALVDRAIIEAGVDAAAWRAETERLGPALRRASREVRGAGGGASSTSSTWQPRLEHLHALANRIAAISPALRVDAAGLAGVLRLDLEAVDQREAFLRRHIRLDIHERAFRVAQTSLSEVSAHRQSAHERVAARTRELAALNERCMSTAIAVEDAAGGSAAAGAAKLTRLKDALRDVTREIADMEVKIALARERLEGKRLRRRRAGLPPPPPL